MTIICVNGTNPIQSTMLHRWRTCFKKWQECRNSILPTSKPNPLKAHTLLTIMIFLFFYGKNVGSLAHLCSNIFPPGAVWFPGFEHRSAPLQPRSGIREIGAPTPALGPLIAHGEPKLPQNYFTAPLFFFFFFFLVHNVSSVL